MLSPGMLMTALGWLLVPFANAGTKYWIRTDGSNANTGSDSVNAWATIGKFNQSSSAGDTALILPGNYGNDPISPEISEEGNATVYLARFYGDVTIQGAYHATYINGDKSIYIQGEVVGVDTGRFVFKEIRTVSLAFVLEGSEKATKRIQKRNQRRPGRLIFLVDIMVA